MSGMKYFCVYYDFYEGLEALTMEERGRLFTACFQFGRGESVDSLTGNERILFPIIKNQIAREKASYAEKCEKNRAAAMVRVNKEKKQKKQNKKTNAEANRETKREAASTFENSSPIDDICLDESFIGENLTAEACYNGENFAIDSHLNESFVDENYSSQSAFSAFDSERCQYKDKDKDKDEEEYKDKEKDEYTLSLSRECYSLYRESVPPISPQRGELRAREARGAVISSQEDVTPLPLCAEQPCVNGNGVPAQNKGVTSSPKESNGKERVNNAVGVNATVGGNAAVCGKALDERDDSGINRRAEGENPPAHGENSPAHGENSASANAKTDLFERFWAEYPKQVGKVYARDMWQSIAPDSALAQKIILGVMTAKRLDKRFLEGFIPNASKWLRGREWENVFAVGGGMAVGATNSYANNGSHNRATACSSRKYTYAEIEAMGCELLD